MSENTSENDMSHWFSTYGLITAERILGRYQIKLAQNDLVSAIKIPFSFYHRLVEIPLKNVLNGIVFEQAKDYHVYVQKLFIDYLLSGENSKNEAAQGAGTREGIENERQQLVSLGEEYHKKELEHNNLIARSQETLIKITRNFNEALQKSISAVTVTLKHDPKSVRQAIIHALIHCDLTDPQLQSNQFLFTEKMNEVLKLSFNEDLKAKLMENLSGVLDIVLHFSANVGHFLEQTNEIHVQANSFRSQFYETILRVVELLNLLPEYKIDPIQDEINRESLHFDKSIGKL